MYYLFSPILFYLRILKTEKILQFLDKKYRMGIHLSRYQSKPKKTAVIVIKRQCSILSLLTELYLCFRVDSPMSWFIVVDRKELKIGTQIECIVKKTTKFGECASPLFQGGKLRNTSRRKQMYLQSAQQSAARFTDALQLVATRTNVASENRDGTQMYKLWLHGRMYTFVGWHTGQKLQQVVLFQQGRSFNLSFSSSLAV